MKQTMTNLTKLRISGMLSEAAQREAEQKIMEKRKQEYSENEAQINFV